jgi:predicted nucleic acid-binding protein
VTVHRGGLSQLRAFVDSSAFLALVNPHDEHHGAARAIWTRLTAERWRTTTSNFVVAETHQLFLIRLGHRHATAFVRQFL